MYFYINLSISRWFIRIWKVIFNVCLYFASYSLWENRWRCDASLTETCPGLMLLHWRHTAQCNETGNGGRLTGQCVRKCGRKALACMRLCWVKQWLPVRWLGLLNHWWLQE